MVFPWTGAFMPVPGTYSTLYTGAAGSDDDLPHPETSSSITMTIEKVTLKILKKYEFMVFLHSGWLPAFIQLIAYEIVMHPETEK
jgi:hypothetical protein